MAVLVLIDAQPLTLRLFLMHGPCKELPCRKKLVFVHRTWHNEDVEKQKGLERVVRIIYRICVNLLRLNDN